MDFTNSISMDFTNSISMDFTNPTMLNFTNSTMMDVTNPTILEMSNSSMLNTTNPSMPAFPSYADIFWSIFLFEYTPAEVVVVSIIRYLIWIFGIVGNITLITTIARHNVFHGSGFMLMVNLAIGEMYTSTIDVATHAISLYWYNNRDSRLDIKALSIETVFAVFGYNVTVFTILVISFNRFWSVVYYASYKTIFTTRNTLFLIAAVYLASLIMVVPLFPDLDITLYVYHPRLWFHFLDKISVPSGLITFYVYQIIAILVVVIMISFYSIVIIRLRSVWKVQNRKRLSTAGQGSVIKRKDVLLTIQFALVTLVFIVTWIVLSIYIFLSESIMEYATANKWIVSGVVMMFQANYAVNPYVYMIVNKRMRSYMKATVTFQQPSSTQETPI